MVCPRSLMRASFAAGFGPHEGLLIQLALEQCGPLWDVDSGEPWQDQVERFPVRFWLAHLAAETGEGSQHFRRALRALLAAGVMYHAADGALRLNGDVAAWIHPKSGRPRLAGRLLAYCLGER